jgi:hypothetical protein
MEDRTSLAPSVPGAPNTRAGNEAKLEISVVFTSAERTSAALQEAGRLAQELNAHISLIVPQTVPFPLPLINPPVLLDFSRSRLGELAGESRVETSVRLYLCREREHALRMALAPGSLVVIGTRGRWWRGGDRRLAAHLRRAGHRVVIVETE